MAGFDLNSIVDVLNEAKGYGVSFESQAKKWETEAGGNLFRNQIKMHCTFHSNK